MTFFGPSGLSLMPPLTSAVPTARRNDSPLFKGSSTSSNDVCPLQQGSHSNPDKPFEIELNISQPTPIISPRNNSGGVKSRQKGLKLGKPELLTVRLYDPKTGLPPADLQIVHEKPAHFFMISQDLQTFQHVHPEILAPGLLEIPVTFPSPGLYQLFTQFTPFMAGNPLTGTPPRLLEEQTLKKPIQIGSSQQISDYQNKVGSNTIHKPLVPDAAFPKWVDGYEFRVSGLPTRQQPMGMFQVSVFKNGAPVRNIEPFLGASAHGVIVSENLQSFIHTHPMNEVKQGVYQSPIQFHTEIHQPGLYKMWIQTQIDGKLHTVDWIFQV